MKFFEICIHEQRRKRIAVCVKLESLSDRRTIYLKEYGSEGASPFVDGKCDRYYSSGTYCKAEIIKEVDEVPDSFADRFEYYKLVSFTVDSGGLHVRTERQSLWFPKLEPEYMAAVASRLSLLIGKPCEWVDSESTFKFEECDIVLVEGD